MNLEIRVARLEDAHIVHSLVQSAFAEYRGVILPPTEAESETLEQVILDVEEGVVLLALSDETPVGTVRYRQRPDCLYVRRVAVPPEYRGQGIAAALMIYLEEIARELGYARLCLSTRRSLPRNHTFYVRLGYRITRVEELTNGSDASMWFEKTL